MMALAARMISMSAPISPLLVEVKRVEQRERTERLRPALSLLALPLVHIRLRVPKRKLIQPLTRSVTANAHAIAILDNSGIFGHALTQLGH